MSNDLDTWALLSSGEVMLSECWNVVHGLFFPDDLWTGAVTWSLSSGSN